MIVKDKDNQKRKSSAERNTSGAKEGGEHGEKIGTRDEGES